jgi:tetratricopeptide (TPR) repeat protein
MDPSNAITAARLNNEGVNLYQNGHYDQAITVFSKGLSLVKRVLATQGDEESSEEQEDDCADSSLEPVQNPSCHFHKMEESVAMDICGSEEDFNADEPFIFRAPIFIPSQATDLISFKYYVKSSFILLYNLALSHQLSALDGDDTAKRLRKALALYELAYTIQMTEDIELTALQTMAMVNNLGQIHTALDNEENARQCFQHLLSTIMFLNDCGERDSVEQMEGFIANVMPLIIIGGTSPAAAA